MTQEAITDDLYRTLQTQDPDYDWHKSFPCGLELWKNLTITEYAAS